MVKGWGEAAYDWILMADSNVLLPPGAIRSLLARHTSGTGLVCSPPIGSAPEGVAAELEGALEDHQGRWQIVADIAGAGFRQGKAMLWQRQDLDAAGGILALALEAGEDAAATKLLRARNLKVSLAERPFFQPLGRRRFVDVWKRQLRWARLRRGSFPLLYLPELFAGAFFPLLALTGMAVEGYAPFSAVPALLLLGTPRRRPLPGAPAGRCRFSRPSYGSPVT